MSGRFGFVAATVITVAGELVGWAGVVLGDAIPPNLAESDLIHVLGGLTSLGFAVWYAWFVTVKVIPEKDKANREELGKIREDHRGQMSSLIADFRDESRLQREAHQLTVSQIMGRCPGHSLQQHQSGEQTHA